MTIVSKRLKELEVSNNKLDRFINDRFHEIFYNVTPSDYPTLVFRRIQVFVITVTNIVVIFLGDKPYGNSHYKEQLNLVIVVRLS